MYAHGTTAHTATAAHSPRPARRPASPASGAAKAAGKPALTASIPTNRDVMRGTCPGKYRLTIGGSRTFPTPEATSATAEAANMTGKSMARARTLWASTMAVAASRRLSSKPQRRALTAEQPGPYETDRRQGPLQPDGGAVERNVGPDLRQDWRERRNRGPQVYCNQHHPEDCQYPPAPYRAGGHFRHGSRERVSALLQDFGGGGGARLWRRELWR